MQHVELRAVVPAQLEHQREVGVVLGHLDVRRCVDVVATGPVRHRLDRQLDRAEAGVGARGGEDATSCPRRTSSLARCHVIDSSPPVKGSAIGKRQLATRQIRSRLAGEAHRHLLTSR